MFASWSERSQRDLAAGAFQFTLGVIVGIAAVIMDSPLIALVTILMCGLGVGNFLSARRHRFDEPEPSQG